MKLDQITHTDDQSSSDMVFHSSLTFGIAECCTHIACAFMCRQPKQSPV